MGTWGTGPCDSGLAADFVVSECCGAEFARTLDRGDPGQAVVQRCTVSSSRMSHVPSPSGTAVIPGVCG